MIYTSGTTGPSKGVLVPWASCPSSRRAAPTGMLAGRRYYSVYPAFHVSGKNGALHRRQAPGRLVLRDTFSLTRTGRRREFGCTAGGLSGPMANCSSLPDHARPRRTTRSPVAIGPLIPRSTSSSARFGVRVATAYGMTEIGVPIVSAASTSSTNCGHVRKAGPGYEAPRRRRARREVPARRGRRARRAHRRAVDAERRLLPAAREDRGGVAQRMVPHRRRLHLRRRRQLLLRRPHQGRHPAPGREHLVVRGGGPWSTSTLRCRSRGHRGPLRARRGRHQDGRRPPARGVATPTS